MPDEYYEEVLPRLVRALANAAPVVVHVCSELPVAWSPRAAARWEALLRAAGARRVAFHFGTPWPAGWKSSGVTRTFAPTLILTPTLTPTQTPTLTLTLTLT